MYLYNIETCKSLHRKHFKNVGDKIWVDKKLGITFEEISRGKKLIHVKKYNHKEIKKEELKEELKKELENKLKELNK